jgi:P pilus assembly chaperone PapD
MSRIATQKSILGILTILFLVGMGIGGIFSTIKSAQADEIGPNQVQGKVTSIYTNVFRKGTIVVKSDKTGKTYTFYVGTRTIYIPHRYPSTEETVKVTYINDRGFLKATRVEILQSS